MSTASLDQTERATYFLGKAIAAAMTQMAEASDEESGEEVERIRSAINLFVAVKASREELRAIRETFGWHEDYGDYALNLLQLAKTCYPHDNGRPD